MSAAEMTLSVGDYVFYSIMGICVVFFALVLLMVIIKILIATTSPKAEPAAAADAAAVPAPAADVPLAPGTAGDLKLFDTDPRTAAMIMAIVADELQKPLNELRFISIREIKD